MSGSDSKQFSISGIYVTLKADQPVEVSEYFEPFLSSGGDGYWAAFICVPELELPDGEYIYEGNEMSVVKGESGTSYRIFRNLENHGEIYAVGRYDLANRHIEIRYNVQGRPHFVDSASYFSAIAWESILMREDRIIFHAACIDTKYGGILFSGPSGIGKSTQAELWEQYEHVRQINGDRPILHRSQDGWWAYGSPYAGSSGVHVNDCCKVRAVALLQQAKSCAVRRLTEGQAFRRIVSGMTVNIWDKAFVQKACDCAEALMQEVPVYELSCTPDRRAVECLKSVLERGGF